MDAVTTHHESPLPSPERPALGELLKRDGFLTDERLEEALVEGAASGERLGEVVVRRGWATDDDVAKLLAEQWQLRYVDRASIWFDAEATARMSRAEARRLEALPTRVEDGRVVVAVAEPTEQRIAALREVIGENTVVVVVPKSALDAGLSSQLLGGGGGDRGPAVAPAEPAADVESQPEAVAAAEETSPPDPPVPLNASVKPAVAPAPPLLHTHESPRRAAPRDVDTEPELEDLLALLQEAARDAGSLQRTVTTLAERLDGLAGELAAVSRRLGQRHEMTDRLKAQLADLTRTLDTLE